MWVQSEDQGRQNREKFEDWKRSVFSIDTSVGGRDGDIREEDVEDMGMKRERRETFDAWKKGVVPPLKGEQSIGS